MLKQNLRAQVEEVCRLVEQEQVWLVQEEGGELDAGLPAAGEFLDRPSEERSLELEFAGHLAALPIGPVAVAHQEVEGCFTWQKGIVLPEVAQPQPRMPDDFAAVEFLLAEDHAEQRALAGTVSSNEADFAVVGNRGARIFEEHLVTVAFGGVLDLEQDGHGG